MTNQENVADKKDKKFTYQEYFEMGIEAAKDDPRLKNSNKTEGKEG
jgi:hypothetical protein